LFWQKSTAGWLLMVGLFWEKSTAGWYLISQTNRATQPVCEEWWSVGEFPLFLNSYFELLQPVRLAGGWCWFVVRVKYCWLVASGRFVLREKHCWLVADKPNEHAVRWHTWIH
jgi:hypothetical protein